MRPAEPKWRVCFTPFVEVGLIYAVSRILQNQREERLSDCLSRNTVYFTLFTLVVTESIFSTALGASQVTLGAKCDGLGLEVGYQINVVTLPRIASVFMDLVSS